MSMVRSVMSIVRTLNTQRPPKLLVYRMYFSSVAAATQPVDERTDILVCTRHDVCPASAGVLLLCHNPIVEFKTQELHSMQQSYERHLCPMSGAGF